MKYIYAFFLLLMIPVTAHAQTEFANPFELHIPPKVISGVEYEGMITIREPSKVNIDLKMATSSHDIDIDEFVILEAGKNHVIFPFTIRTVENETVIIYAVTEEYTSTQTTDVYAVVERPTKLVISAPTTNDQLYTSSNLLPIKILVTDNQGVPITPDVPIKVTISSSSDIKFGTSTAPSRSCDVSGNADNGTSTCISTTSYDGYSELLDVTIPAGKNQIDVFTVIRDDGTIYAISDGLQSAFLNVEYESEKIEVKIRAGPTPASTNTVGHFVVWIERNEKVYVPDGVLTVKIHSSNKEIISFPANIASVNKRESNNKGDEIEVKMINGFAVGEIFYGKQPTNENYPQHLTATIDGYGSGITKIAVVEPLTSFSHDFSVSFNCMWVYPEKPADRGWIIVAPYAQQVDGEPSCLENAEDLTYSAPLTTEAAELAQQIIDEGGDVTDVIGIAEDDIEESDEQGELDEEIEQEIERTAVVDELKDKLRELLSEEKSVPIPQPRYKTSPDDLSNRITLSNSDKILIHDNLTPAQTDRGHLFSDVLDPGLIPVASAIYPFEALTVDEHRLIAVVDGLPSEEMIFESTQSYGEDRKVLISGIPANIGINSDIAFLYIINGEDGPITDSTVLHERKSAAVFDHTNAILNLDVDRIWIGGSTTVSGTWDKNSADLRPFVSGIESEVSSITPAGIIVELDLWMPERFNTGSEFPLAAHSLSSDGVPLARLSPNGLIFSDTRFELTDNPNRAKSTRDGFGVLNIITSSRHIAERTFESFSNRSDQYISVNPLTNDTIRLGSDILMGLLSGPIDDPDVLFDAAGLDFVKNEAGIYQATPEKDGEYEIEVVVQKEGWEDYIETFTITVDHLVDITADMISDDGVKLPLSLNMTSHADETIKLRNEETKSILAGIYEIALPEEYIVGSDRKYKLEGLKLNEESIPVSGSFTHNMINNTKLYATYQREITVSFEGFMDSESELPDIDGNGDYRYGDMVTITANPVPELFGLIWHIPTEWSDLPIDAVSSGGVIQFEAIDSVSGYVEYEKNYTALMALIGSAVTVPIVIIRIKSPDSFVNIVESLKSKLKKKPKPKQDSKPKKKSRVMGLFGR